MPEDPFYCENCDMELSHNDIETVTDVPQLNVETFELKGQPAEVYKCSGCGLVIGFDIQ